MADVFISYQEESAGDMAQQIAAALESNDISCWYAKRDIPPGGDFARYIPPQIDACKVFLLILNDSIVHQSNHVENEVGLAFGRLNHGEKITILPLEVGDFKRESWIRYYLVHTQSVKIPLGDELHIEELTQKISGILEKAPSTRQNQKALAKILKSGPCGGGVTYMLYENGMLVILGIGKIAAKPNPDVWVDSIHSDWVEESDIITHIIIENGITSIGDYVFYGCQNVKSVTIPDSITSIGYKAFYGCWKLKEVSIPTQTNIAYDAFPDTVVITRRP